MGSRLIGRGTPHDISVQASADLSLLQYTFVKFNTGVSGGPATTLAVLNASSSPGFILQDNPISGKAGRIRLEGTSALKVDGTSAIVPGDFLKADSAGLGVKATTGTYYGAVAMEASAAAGDIIEVLVQRGYMA